MSRTAGSTAPLPGRARHGARRLGQVLPELRTRFPESLLAGRGWKRLVDRVADLPAEAAHWCGFEFRLGDPEPSADFFEGLAREPVRRYYVERGERSAPGSARAWLAKQLATKRSSPARVAPLQVGYDIVEISGEQRATPINYLTLHQAPPRLTAGFTAAGLARILAESAGRDGDGRAFEGGIARVYEALPPEARVIFAVAPPDREAVFARLLVAHLSAETVGGFLDRIGWVGPVSAVLRVISSLEDVSHHFILAVSLD